MAHITTNTSADDVFATWINRTFVSDLEYSLQHQKFTLKGNIEKGAGASVLRFVDFAAPNPAASGPITSYSAGGQANITEASVSANEITQIATNPTEITVQEFGEFLKISQLYEYAAVTGTRERLRKRLMDGANGSLDSAVRIAAQQTTNVVFADTSVQGGSTTGPSSLGRIGAATIMFAKKTLFGGLATGFTGVPGHPNNHFAAILTPTQELDIITEVTTQRVYWNNAVVNVPGTEGVMKWVNGYIGSIYGVACYTTQNYSTVSYTASCTTGWVYADGGVGAASFNEMEPRIIINDVNSPYKNVNSIAWHALFNAKLISSTRVIRLYSTGL